MNDQTELQDSFENNEETYVTINTETPLLESTESILDLLRENNLGIVDEKQLTKQIHKVLIESDSSGKMRRKLCFFLDNLASSWQVKQNKYKTLNLSGSFRLVAQTLNGKDYVLGVMDHNTYELMMPDIVRK